MFWIPDMKGHNHHFAGTRNISLERKKLQIETTQNLNAVASWVD